MKKIRLFITYFKKNNDTNELYAGRASGKYTGNEISDAARIMRVRDSSHHKNIDSFDVGRIDQVSLNSDAIREREQMMIEKLKRKGISGNERKGISPRNKKRKRYLQAALKLFGAVSIVLYFMYLCNIG